MVPAVAIAAALMIAALDSSEEPAGCTRPPLEYADRGFPFTRNVALTFDDGPSAATNRLLATLRLHDATATFFLIGRRAERHRRLVARIAAAGHELANHTYTHRVLLRGNAPAARELRATNKVLREITGKAPRVFRAAHGVVTPHVTEAVRRERMVTVGWDLDSRDWAPTGSRPAQVFERVASRIHPGAIVLMHDGRPSGATTAEALPRILRMLRARRYRTATVSELLAATCTGTGEKR